MAGEVVTKDQCSWEQKVRQRGLKGRGDLRWRAALNTLSKAMGGSGEQRRMLATVAQIAGEVLTRYRGEDKEVVGLLGGKRLAPHMDGDRIRDC